LDGVPAGGNLTQKTGARQDESCASKGKIVLDALIARGAFRSAISVPRRRGRLHVMPTSVGLEHACGPGYDFDGRQRGPLPFAVLQQSLEGRGRLRHDGRNYRIEPGQTMLVTIPHAHRYWVDAGEPWSFFWIAVTGQEALRLVYAIQAVAGPVLTLQRRTIDQLASHCLELGNTARDPSAVGRLSAMAYAALMALFDDVLDRHQTSRLDKASLEVARVYNHIRANLNRPLSVGDLAEVAGYSRAHFSRMFAAEAGLAPAEFVSQERMRLASRLLPNGALSIKEIAGACGFADSNYFAKAFRQSFGLSPTQFRSTIKESIRAGVHA
jgi:AraC-like DNA-binding protein